MSKMSRRTLFKAAGAAGAAAVSPGALAQVATEAAAQPLPLADPSSASTYAFLNADEAAFVDAAVARLIPADDRWPGAREVGVTNYIDKQMASAWGGGERLYRSGPWQPGTPGQGYQLPLTPAELFRTAVGAINREFAAKGMTFAELSPAEQDIYLHAIENDNRSLGGVPAKEFFAELWRSTIEGFFGDPVYGGNRDMASWRMIGFPGAYASYYDLVDKHGIALDRRPTSLAEDAMGHVHVDPNIPTRVP